jgi:hypothetical protein
MSRQRALEQWKPDDLEQAESANESWEKKSSGVLLRSIGARPEVTIF